MKKRKIGQGDGKNMREERNKEQKAGRGEVARKGNEQEQEEQEDREKEKDVGEEEKEERE
jgi:hypothetical protein